MELFVDKKTGRIWITCADCGGDMTCVNECYPQYDVLVFKCENKQCGHVINWQQGEPENVELTKEQIAQVNARVDEIVRRKHGVR